MAGELLTRGDRVTMTAEGRRTFPRMRSYSGVFVNYPSRGWGAPHNGARVHVDGYKQPDYYAASFWVKAGGGERGH
jgi:hypothetical protein